MKASNNSRIVRGVGINFRKADREMRCLIHPGVLSEVRDWVLYQSPTNTLLDNPTFATASAKEQLEALERYKMRTAKATSKLYGPNHPQSFENLYPLEALEEAISKKRASRTARRWRKTMTELYQKELVK